MTPKQKLPKNVRDLGKLFVAKGFKNVPKVQKIAQSGHTGRGGEGRESYQENVIVGEQVRLMLSGCLPR